MTKQILLSSLVVLFYSMSLLAQQFNLRYEQFTNDGVNYDANVQMNGTTAYSLGSANLVFTYNPAIMGTPTLQTNSLGANFSVTVTEPVSGTVSINIVLTSTNGGEGIVASSSGWTDVATIRFNVTTVGAIPVLEWQYTGKANKSVVFLDDDATQIFANTLNDMTGDPLPLDLKSFTANWLDKLNNDVVLEWITSAETDMSHFDIERSFDGNNWTAIEQITAVGDENSETVYGLTDVNVGLEMPGSIAYYRLKMVDASEEFEYSGTQVVERDGVKGNGYIKTWPNPFTESMNFEYSFENKNNADILIRITHPSGAVVYESLENDTNGIGLIQLNDLQDVPKGIYFLTILKGEESIEKKVVKL